MGPSRGPSAVDLTRIRFLVRLVPLVGLVLSLGALANEAPAQGTPVDRVRWLAGCWEQRTGNRVTLEMWMPADGGLMIGGSRTTVGGRVREYEQTRLSERDSTLVYTAHPSGQREASFTSVEVSDSGFVVENLQHDFPQRITYRRRGTDAFVARVEGPGREPGTTRAFELAMKRVSCDPS